MKRAIDFKFLKKLLYHLSQSIHRYLKISLSIDENDFNYWYTEINRKGFKMNLFIAVSLFRLKISYNIVR